MATSKLWTDGDLHVPVDIIGDEAIVRVYLPHLREWAKKAARGDIVLECGGDLIHMVEEDDFLPCLPAHWVPEEEEV